MEAAVVVGRLLWAEMETPALREQAALERLLLFPVLL
jgi:hypothetical protein